MAETSLTREDIEELIEKRLDSHMSEIDARILRSQEGAQSVVLSKLDDIRNELRESQRDQGARIGELENERVRMEAEIKHFRESAMDTKNALVRIENMLSKCITTDNLEEKLQKPLQDIKDSITELKYSHDKRNSEWFSKVIWTITGIVIAAVGAIVLKQIGLV